MILPPVDAHAHVELTVSPEDLAGLEALVFAVTRRADEWAGALERTDETAIWGIGVHPMIEYEVSSFSAIAFDTAIENALLVGEVGLDQKAPAGEEKTRIVFREVLEVLAGRPRPTSIHSVGRSAEVLECLREAPIVAPILHWWRGGKSETEEALEMGCFFSLNGAEAKRPKVISLIPPERILTETDYPHSRRSDPAASRPAAVSTIEAALMEEWGLDEFTMRRQVWRNLAEIFDRCELLDSLPETVQELIVTAGIL